MSQPSDGLVGPDLTYRNDQGVNRLGVPYQAYCVDASVFRLEAPLRITDFASELGYPSDYPVPMGEAPESAPSSLLVASVPSPGRDPEGAQEIAATSANHFRPKTTAVASYDLTSHPSKVHDPWATRRASLPVTGSDGLFIPHTYLPRQRPLDFVSADQGPILLERGTGFELVTYGGHYRGRHGRSIR